MKALRKARKLKGHYNYGVFVRNKKLHYKKRLAKDKYEYDLKR